LALLLFAQVGQQVPEDSNLASSNQVGKLQAVALLEPRAEVVA